MSRIKRGVNTKKKHKKYIKLAKGFYGRKKNVYTRAMEQVMKGWQASYVGRKDKKRTFRQIWIVRINAACRQNGISYSRFIDGLHKANIELDRKQLAELAINDNNAFSKLVDIAKENVAVASK
ncbi:MAG: 50S ribosomal protein L20 [Candidatus Goldbacteria bacterium]|nr:50S ribosomal protein L20 [Candidatus Goldiibacteriota bacterium]